MARPVTYTWPASNTTLIAAAQTLNPSNDIAQLQNAAGAVNLTLNGTLVSNGIATLYPAANVSIGSANDLHLLTFTVTGQIANGALISEAVTGPNANTVFTTNQFITVTQIAVSGAGNGIVAGWAQPMTLTTGGLNFLYYGISRAVSITSNGDLTGVTFVVTGTLNGQVVSASLAGGNNTTVYTTQVFDSVSSVTAGSDMGALTASVGSGLLGYTHWYLYNYHATTLGFTAQVVRTATTINYNFDTTLDDVQIVSSPTVFNPIAAMTGASTSQFATYNNVLRYSRISLIAGTTSTGALVATFLEQGIT